MQVGSSPAGPDWVTAPARILSEGYFYKGIHIHQKMIVIEMGIRTFKDKWWEVYGRDLKQVSRILFRFNSNSIRMFLIAGSKTGLL